MLRGIITDSTQQYCSFSLSVCLSDFLSVCLAVRHWSCTFVFFCFFTRIFLCNIPSLSPSHQITRQLLFIYYLFMHCLFLSNINLYQFSICLNVFFLFINFFTYVCFFLHICLTLNLFKHNRSDTKCSLNLSRFCKHSLFQQSQYYCVHSFRGARVMWRWLVLN